ncbi:hypothetical protein HF325_001883 [Metschnikowia pulcherrima]|uniref:Serine/threonine-protein phosphatase n=1 Tax=Metschnikowia pulcherrima TaxID=27326 RepID=A0A8H7GWJ1_9ASCO|nr:hypothetical protein HF325_001883 [Metschnikowia pulcherrima]
MGNNPSKNDPLPNISTNKNVGTSSDMIAGDVESEETSSLALSRPTGNGSDVLSERLSHYSLNGARVSDSQSPPQNIPSGKGSLRRKSAPELELEVDIDASMAMLLANSLLQSHQSPSKWKHAQARHTNVHTSEYGSSVDSQKSDDLSVSPLFTASDRDASLLLSLFSPSTLPTAAKAEGTIVMPAGSALELIVETSIESTPEPRSCDTTPQPITKAKFLRSSVPSQGSISPVSLSPPLIPVAKKTDFDIDGIIDRLLAIGRAKESFKTQKARKQKDKLPLTTLEIKSVLAKSRSVFMDQPTLLKLSPPVKIVGDIHGQFFDLIRIFDSCGYPPYSNYLFLGDYVDRGHKSLEVILLLLCYKIKYPENFFMLRGNHESANITKIYGFYDECKRRLPLISGSHKLWKSFIDVFNTLPIAATINDKIFCIHGGLSPELRSLKQVEQIQRPTDIPDRGLLADLLWSDPDALVRTYSHNNWPKNDRGVSYCFGKKHVDHFLGKFNMDLIVRGHMVVEDGYEFFNKRKLVTVFLAPNYCGDFNNYGAIMSVDRSLCCSFELIKPQ